MKVVILCGGKGFRMKEITEELPKPMAQIGDVPMIFHIMRLYMRQGFNDFILLLGYKGDKIKEYFINQSWRDNDFVLENKGGQASLKLLTGSTDYKITFLNTGEASMTGSRIKQAEKYIDGDTFMLTYGDGLSDVNISKLLEYHYKKGRIATLTGIKRENPYGILKVKKDTVLGFDEKPEMAGWINGGFFVLNKGVFDYLSESRDCIFERQPLEDLAKDEQLTIYRHKGFWIAIDTYKELNELNSNWGVIKEKLFLDIEE